MGWLFFDNQRIDRAGILAVRLEKLVLIFYLLSLLEIGFFVYMSTIIPAFLGVLAIACVASVVAWIVWFIGWKGATKRNPLYLMVYFIQTLIGSILQVMFGFPFVMSSSILMTSLAAFASEGIVWREGIVIASAILGFVAPLALNILAMYYAIAIRRAILISKRPEVLRNQEEGSCNSVTMDYIPVNLDQQPQQPQQELPPFAPPVLPPPVFYPVLQQPNIITFVPQN